MTKELDDVMSGLPIRRRRWINMRAKVLAKLLAKIARWGPKSKHLQLRVNRRRKP
jgi:hypothetical protein